MNESASRRRDIVQLDGKVTLVVGGASGIGRASAEVCADAGSRVMVADIDDRRGREVVEGICADGGTADFVHVDATNEESVAASVAATVRAFNGLHVLVNTPGTADLHSAPGRAWHDFLDLFLKSTYYSCLHAVDEIERSGGGSIINISSIAGHGLRDGEARRDRAHQDDGAHLRDAEHPRERDMPGLRQDRYHRVPPRRRGSRSEDHHR
jgi:NAD(P)-dependent dehydrogenase (short-subunit alcohol dehydrogenase family)